MRSKRGARPPGDGDQGDLPPELPGGAEREDTAAWSVEDESYYDSGFEGAGYETGGYEMGGYDAAAYGQQAGYEAPYTQGPYTEGAYGQGPYTQGAYGQGPYTQGPYGQGPYAAGRYGRGPYDPRYAPYGPPQREALAAYRDSRRTSVVPQVWDERYVTQGGAPPRRRRRRGNGPWPELAMIAAVGVVIAAVSLAVTSANRQNLASSGAPTTAPQTSLAPRATSTTRLPSTSTGGDRGTPSSAPRPRRAHPATGAKPATAGAQNLLVPGSVRQALVRSWLATNPGGAELGAKDVAGITKGALYYGYQPADRTYWATAQFQPSARLHAEASTAAGQAALVPFKDKMYVFSWRQGGGVDWALLGEVRAGSCPGLVPKPVLAAWALCGLKPPQPTGAGPGPVKPGKRGRSHRSHPEHG